MTADLIEHIDHFQRRVVQEAIADATAEYWTRRAEAFEAAAPRLGDFNGRATLRDLRAAEKRCRDSAEACRARAAVAIRGVA